MVEKISLLLGRTGRRTQTEGKKQDKGGRISTRKERVEAEG